jgi:hypothetical protein
MGVFYKGIPGSGRKRGTPNRATLERRLAEAVILEARRPISLQLPRQQRHSAIHSCKQWLTSIWMPRAGRSQASSVTVAKQNARRADSIPAFELGSLARCVREYEAQPCDKRLSQ